MASLLLRRAFVVACNAVASATAVAQNYPAKPIRLIVLFATGGLSNIVACMLAAKLTDGFRAED